MRSGANKRALEREVKRFRREMDMLRREKVSLRDQIKSLQRTVHALKDGDRGRDRTPSSDETVPARLSCFAPLSGLQEMRGVGILPRMM